MVDPFAEIENEGEIPTKYLGIFIDGDRTGNR